VLPVSAGTWSFPLFNLANEKLVTPFPTPQSQPASLTIEFKYSTFDRLRFLILHNGQLYRQWRFVLPSNQIFPSNSGCNKVGDATTVGGQVAYTITFCRPMTTITTSQTSWRTIDGGNFMNICLSYGTICKGQIL
jgi:hypothetical protein